MSTFLAKATFLALLVLPLALSSVLGLLTPYVSLLLTVPLVVISLMRPGRLALYASYDAWVLLAIFVLFALVCAVTADSLSDMLRALNFAMFLAYGPIARFFDQHRWRSPAELVARLSAVGVIFGFAQVVASDVLAHASRPSAINLGPIVLSNALLALGFISLGGLLIRRDRIGLLYLPPVVLAIVATVLTGSRGPLLAVPFASLAAAFFVWRVRFRGSPRLALGGAAALLVALVGAAVTILQGRAGSIPTIVAAIANGSTVADESTRQRLVLYRAGLQSFAQSPWIGHGWGNIMSSVKPFISVSDQWLLTWLPQLHNDVLNFAVAGGVVGLLAYLLIVSAPVIGALSGPHDSLRMFRLYGATVLAIVYVGGGLTDLMFGFEFHTFLFAMLTAILLHFCRDGMASETKAKA